LLRQQFAQNKVVPGARLLLPVEDTSAPQGVVLSNLKLSTPELTLVYGYTCFANMLQLYSLKGEREANISGLSNSNASDQVRLHDLYLSCFILMCFLIAVARLEKV